MLLKHRLKVDLHNTMLALALYCIKVGGWHFTSAVEAQALKVGSQYDAGPCVALRQGGWIAVQ